MKPIATTTRLSNINPPPQLPPPQRPPCAAQLDLSQAAAATLVFISTIFCFFFLCAYCRHCTGGGGGARSASDSHRPLMLVHQGDHSYSSEPKPAASLPPELPLVLYAAGADGKEEEEEEPARDCVVCLGEFEEDKELKVIPGCGHLFHQQCIDAWLVSHGSCPVCRCSQLFGVAVGEGEGEGEGEGRGEVCVDAMMGESGGEDDEEACAGGIREEFGMGRREREEMGGRGGEEEEVEGRRYCCSSSSSRRRHDGGTATQL